MTPNGRYDNVAPSERRTPAKNSEREETEGFKSTEDRVQESADDLARCLQFIVPRAISRRPASEHVHRSGGGASQSDYRLPEDNTITSRINTTMTANAILIQLFGYSPAMRPVTPLMTTWYDLAP